MIKILQIIILVFFSLLMMSASCDKGSEGCTDSSLCDYNGDGVFDEDENCACNYDETAAIDDNSCWYKSPGCDCEDPPGSVIDCLSICDADILNDPDEDADGNCCSKIDEFCDKIVVGGCIDETNCKYDEEKPPTHNARLRRPYQRISAWRTRRLLCLQSWKPLRYRRVLQVYMVFPNR